jgi:predicted RecB family nuclease
VVLAALSSDACSQKAVQAMQDVRATGWSRNSLNWREQRWYSDAACRGQLSSRWFSKDPSTSEGALTVCHTCPVEPECLAIALEHHELAGIWGGTTEAQRVRLRRNSGSSGPTIDDRATSAVATTSH